MQHFDASDLRDPQPPVPGERERTAVAERAHELGRRRRLVQGGGALALVAAVAVSVAALTGGGGTGPGGTNWNANRASGASGRCCRFCRTIRTERLSNGRAHWHAAA